MRANKKLAIEKLERREVFSVAPGFGGLTPDAQVTDHDALNIGDALVVDQTGNVGFFDGSDVGLSVVSPRDAASAVDEQDHGSQGLQNTWISAAVDQLFAEYQVTARPDTSISGL